MVDLVSLVTCPACATPLPTDPGALGWTEIAGRWWCPLHAFNEQRRLKKQTEELRWYDENIRRRKLALEKTETDRESALSAARRAGLRRQDPHVQRKLTEIDDYAVRLQREIAALQVNREDAVRRHKKS